jgi:hypothetical protein
MDSVTNITTAVVVILLAVGLYYLYQYLYGSSGITTATVVNGVKNAVRKDGTPIVVASDSLPPLYEGGEYTVSFWIYINDFKYRRDMNKHVLSLGGTTATGFDTLRVYLGAYKNSLSVRVTSRSPGAAPSAAPGSAPGPATDYLPLANYNAEFNTIPQGLDQGYFPSCDLTSVDLQRWVNITVVLNGRTTDVYMDGKLARSCVLPSFYKVDPAGYKMTILDKGGFGGYVSNVRTYGYTLNPDQVYRNYMAGPGPQYTFYGWLTSLFDPKSAGSLDYPKMN